MTCPHCGAEAPAGPKFCPSCSRLLDSPLLAIKRELDAARGRPLHQQLAAATAERAAALAARTAPPPVPDQPVVYRLQNTGPSVRHPPAQPAAAGHDLSTVLQERLGAMEARGKRKKERQSSSEESHSRPGHRFEPTAHHHGAEAAQQHNAQQLAQAAAKAKAHAKAAAQPPPAPERFPRPAALTVLGLLDIFAAMALFAVFAQLTNANPEPRLSIVDSTRYVWGGLAAFFLVTGLAVLGRWRIGRLMQMLIALPMLAAPWTGGIGVIYGIVLLFYLTRGSTKAIFAGKSPRQLTQAQWAGANAALKFSPVLAALFFIFAIVPALGIGRLLDDYVPQAAAMVDQARAGQSIAAILSQATAQTPASIGEPEPGPIGDPQTTAAEDVVAVMRAQAAYASLNGGFYDRVECLVAPANCIPNRDPQNTTQRLEPRFTRMERNGYVFQLRLSEPPDPRPDTVSKSGTAEYAYRAVPIKGDGPGFCGNQTGTICTFDAKNVSGDPFKCPEACTPLQRTEPERP